MPAGLATLAVLAGGALLWLVVSLRARRAAARGARDAATGGLGGTRTVRLAGTGARLAMNHDAELVLWFVERGSATLTVDGNARLLTVADAVSVPACVDVTLTGCSDDLSFYEVTLPA